MNDSLWQSIRDEVARDAAAEPVLAGFLHRAILDQPSLEEALGFILTRRLSDGTLVPQALRELFSSAIKAEPAIAQAARADLLCITQRDPASPSLAAALLYLKGLHALETYRVSHWLWKGGRIALAHYLQSRSSQVFGVDIHPAARIGIGIMLDHATGIVIGETAVVADEVSILHEVTLGGTGKESGDRHPKVRSGVMIGRREILGNIVIGQGVKIGAGSVVLKDVPPHTTVAGVPARVVAHASMAQPALEMDQSLPME